MKKILLFVLLAFQVMVATAQTGREVNKMAAMQLVAENQKEIGISDNDMGNVSVSSSYTVSGTDMTMVYLQQTYKNIPVLNKMKVLAFKGEQLASNAGYLLQDMDRNTAGYSGVASIQAEQAVRLAFTEEKLAVPVVSAGSSLENGRVIKYGKLAGVNEEVTAELFWFPVENSNGITVRLGWQVQVAPAGTDDIWHVRIDAQTGAVIEKVNIVLFENLEKPDRGVRSAGNVQLPAANPRRTLQDFGTNFQVTNNRPNSPNIVADAIYNVIPFPLEAPSFGSPATRNNPWTNAPGNASTLGWHNDGTTDFTYTRGNNVWAAEDTIGQDVHVAGQSAPSTTANPSLTFNFTPNFTVEPSLNTVMQRFCITNLFYWSNVVHDITYQYSFDEVSGNFQASNQGRGGAGNDFVRAFAQSGRQPDGTHVHIGNNANFATGADGGLARMRMYLFNAVTTLHINTPGSIAGDYPTVESGFSINNKLAALGPINGQIVYYDDGGGTHEACGAPVMSISGKIALIDRGTCPFTQKVLNAQAAGAIAVIMVNNAPNQLVTMAGDDNSITIPAIFIRQEDGDIIKAQLASNVTATISGTAVFDGDLDAGIMTHEYGHGVSNRLTGGPATASCLQNSEQGGEGWSDYLALMLTTNWATATTASGAAPRPVGTYVVAEPTNGEGIRNYPYSTNISISPLTYAHMGITGAPWLFSNGNEVHNIGEIWCAALWDMTWGIIQQENSINTNLYNFSLSSTGGNTIALRLVLEGMRLQPCSPGFIDARNAILTADRNLYNGRHQCAIWTAFAKRGMGSGASQGLSTSTAAADQTSSFVTPPAPTLNGQPVDVSVNPGDNASFTVSAAAPVSGAALYYNWQVSTNGGGIWNDLSPAVTTPTLSLTAVTVGMNGNKYRCIVTQGCNTTTSSVATLTVAVPTGFTFGTPAPVTATCPAASPIDVVLTTTAIGGFSNPITVSSSTPPTGTVTFVPSATVAPGNSVTVRWTGTNALAPGTYTLTITGTATGAPTQTRNITYTINGGSGPAITAQPANSTVCVNGNTTFSATSAAATNFVWQVSTDGGNNWTTVNNGGVYSTATTATLTITGATAAMNDYRYRVIAGISCGTTTSSPATLTLTPLPSITTHPSNVTVCGGGTATFTVTPTIPAGLSYQWQVSTTGCAGVWTNLVNGAPYTGVSTSTLTITGALATMNGFGYRVVITGGCGTVNSNCATLTVGSSPTVTTSPADVTICSGASASFTAAGTGTNVLYQWQSSTDNGVTWTNINGATNATYSITAATVAQNNTRYRAALSTATCPTAVNTSAAILTVNNCGRELLIYPSPNDGVFTVSLFNEGGAATSRTVKVFDSKGAEVYSAKYSVTGSLPTMTVNLRPAQKGIYHVVIGDANGKKLAEGKVMVNQ